MWCGDRRESRTQHTLSVYDMGQREAQPAEQSAKVGKVGKGCGEAAGPVGKEHGPTRRIKVRKQHLRGPSKAEEGGSLIARGRSRQSCGSQGRHQPRRLAGGSNRDAAANQRSKEQLGTAGCKVRQIASESEKASQAGQHAIVVGLRIIASDRRQNAEQEVAEIFLYDNIVSNQEVSQSKPFFYRIISLTLRLHTDFTDKQTNQPLKLSVALFVQTRTASQ